jgi:hypothetical protein
VNEAERCEGEVVLSLPAGTFAGVACDRACNPKPCPGPPRLSPGDPHIGHVLIRSGDYIPAALGTGGLEGLTSAHTCDGGFRLIS